MDLIAQLSQLATRAESLKRDVVVDQRARGFQTRARQLEPVAATYARLAARASALRRGGVAVQLPEKLGALAKAADEVVDAFEKDPATVIEIPDQLRYRFWDQAGDMSVRSDSALRDAWREHVESSMPRVDRPLFEALPTVTAAHRQELVSVSELTTELTAIVPEDDDGLARLEQLVDRMNRLLAAVDIDGLPLEVRTFVRAIAQQTATLDLITPEVAAWLNAHGLTSRVFLRFGSALR